MAVGNLSSSKSAFAWQPFANLNLLRNPFGELTSEDRIAASVIDYSKIEPFLNQPHVALQFWGECGHGKTTHLLALSQHVKSAQYIYLPEDEKCPPIPERVEPNQTLLIDEAQRLPFWIRRKVFKQGGPLIIGTHRDFRSTLKRFGYVVHGVSFENQLSAIRLQTILNRRIELARFREGLLPLIGLQESQRLCDRFGDNIRAVEGVLFDAFQSLAAENVEAGPGLLQRFAALER